MTTPLLGLSEISEGVVNQATIHNTALRQIEALMVRALSKSTTTPPSSPVAGDSYIVPAGATGVWSSKTNQIAAFIGGGWSYFTPTEGIRLWINDIDAEFVFDGSAWIANGGDASADAAAAIAAHVADADPHPQYLTQAEGDARYTAASGAAQPFDVHAFYPGVPSASAKILRIPVARAVTFPDDFAGSFAKASVAATASTAFDVRKNGASVGTITFAAGASSATFITSGTTVVLAAGDILSITAPATPDATLADAGFVLSGTR